MLERNGTVFIIAHSQFRGVYTNLAKYLKDDLHAEIHLFTTTLQQTKFYERTGGGLYESITAANALYSVCREPIEDPEAVIACATRNETELGVTINELAVSDRHLGRGFSPGGFRHPRSRFSEETSYLQMVNAYNATIDFWRSQIMGKNPTLILNPNKIISVIARRKGISTRTLASSRYENYYYWAHNEYFETPIIEREYHAIQNVPEVHLERPNADHLNLLELHRKRGSRTSTIRSIARHTMKHAYWRIRRYEKSRGYYWKEEVAYLWRKGRTTREMTSKRYTEFHRNCNERILFFPLATEPEISLQRLSPEYLFQLEAIISVARDAPVGTTIAVKEHYAACGRRPLDFYKQIAELKNVRFINMDSRGLEIIRRVKGVVTISGTGGMEAAIMGKPVISFGRHNIYNFLPHVFVIENSSQLKSSMERALSVDFDASEARRNGLRYLAALVKTSFDLGSFTSTKPEVTEDDAMKACYRALTSSIWYPEHTRFGESGV